VAAAVKRDPTITEAVRRQALAWVEPFGRTQVRAQAARLVVPLFNKALPRADVVAILQADTKLSQPLRKQALTLAERYPEDAEILCNATLAVTYRLERGAEPARYQLALRQADAAHKLFPHDVVCVHALGVAQYHFGKYQEAVEKLTLAEKLGGERFPRTANNLKFLAMAQYQLGQKEQAQATFARLREVMLQPEWATNAEAQGFLRKAEELLKTKPANGNK
jgi:hypothetical protein